MHDSKICSSIANRLFLFLVWENTLFYPQYIADDVANSMLIGRAFWRLLAVGRQLHWYFYRFWLFLLDFHFLDNHGNQKRAPQKVRGKRGALKKAVLNHPDQLDALFVETTTSCEKLRVGLIRLTCNRVLSVSGTGPTADRNGPVSVVSHGYNVFPSESEFPENLFTIESQYQTDRFCPKKFGSFSTFASVEHVQDWAAIFIRRLGCLNVEKWANNFKRV